MGLGKGDDVEIALQGILLHKSRHEKAAGSFQLATENSRCGKSWRSEGVLVRHGVLILLSFDVAC